jgi:hypothetical protein
MWLEDLTLMDADTLEDLCDEFEMKIIEGREELRRREEEDDDRLDEGSGLAPDGTGGEHGHV